MKVSLYKYPMTELVHRNRNKIVNIKWKLKVVHSKKNIVLITWTECEGWSNISSSVIFNFFEPCTLFPSDIHSTIFWMPTTIWLMAWNTLNCHTVCKLDHLCLYYPWIMGWIRSKPNLSHDPCRDTSFCGHVSHRSQHPQTKVEWFLNVEWASFNTNDILAPNCFAWPSNRHTAIYLNNQNKIYVYSKFDQYVNSFYNMNKAKAKWGQTNQIDLHFPCRSDKLQRIVDAA